MAEVQAATEQRIADALRAISLPNRLRLLRILQVPHTASEIRLRPWRNDGTFDDSRFMTRQAVDGHLRHLETAGLVRTRPADRNGRPAKEYVLDQAGLFVLLEDVRRLALLRPANTRAAVTQVTAEGPGVGPLVVAQPETTKHAITILNGPREGHTVPLDGKGPWTIGRLEANAIGLPHDPYVSSHNATIHKRSRRFQLEPQADARNGTTHNWTLVPAGARVDLHPGDTIGVGRSIIILRGP